MSKFKDIGRIAGEAIREKLAQTPSGFEKAVQIGLGAMAVLEAAGIKVTVPMLLANDQIKRALDDEQIGEPTFRAAITEARSRWRAEQAREPSASRTNSSGNGEASASCRRRRPVSKASAKETASPKPKKPDTGAAAAAEPDQRDEASLESSDSLPTHAPAVTDAPGNHFHGFIEDINIEEL